MSVSTSQYYSLEASIETLNVSVDVAGDETTATSEVVLRVAALVIVAVLGFGANILVAIVFYRRPTLRSPSNRFVLSLVLANILTSVVVIPVLLAQFLHQPWWVRQAASGLTTLAVTASVFSVLAIAVDRYHAVLSPLHYAMTVTRPRSRGMVAGAWGVALLLALPVLLGATDHACASTRLLALVHALVLASLGFLLPLVALCWIYTRMYKAAHLNNERTRRHSVSTNPGETVSRPGSLEMPLPPNPKAPLNPPPPRRRCSNASFSTLLFREEGKAVKTAIMVITSFLFCFTLYFTVLVIDAWNVKILHSSLRFSAQLIAVGSGCLTPFIYVFRNEAARAESIKVLLFWRSNVSQYDSNVGRNFEAYNNSKTNNGTPSLRHTASQRRESMAYSDSISVQSFHIPMKIVECRHCSIDPPPPSADFVATYEVMDSPGDPTSDVAEPKQKEDKPAKIRRESVTFRLAFMPQRRCQTCIRQNSDSSSGSGHPLLKDGDCGTPPVQKAVQTRRQRFLATRQASSGDEISGSEPNTPKHLGHGEYNNNSGSDAVIFELDEPPKSRIIPRSPPMFKFQETSLERSDSVELPVRQDSDTTIRQDSGYSDVVSDNSSGVSNNLCINNLNLTNSSNLQTRRLRPKLQRLAAVEDEENFQETGETATEVVQNKKNKNSFRTRFNRPAFRIPICEI